ncbi:3-oxoacyl-ACP reductase [Sphingomonas psychrolutea]|uniref:3-oxoacyl-ACP reductase n=1 Tax=Sphingomonas psychrolutea TaxID=1259676 RepID=A0ABQ1G4M8_9SPHN|nr:3-oxoacyl-ACP reductase [Sphingomonas psychrolutea]
MLAARRVERVAALSEQIAADGGIALGVAMDVTDETSVGSAYDIAEAAFGPVDTIIANAGISAPGRSTEIPVAELRAVLDTNVLGVMLTAREGARRLIAAGAQGSGCGRIVLIGSITADMTGQGETMYSASKAAVAHMGRNLAREWVRQGINVNVIQPGYIRTELSGDWFDTDGGRAQIAAFPRRRLQPIGALDAPLLYLCGDESAHMTGAVFTIDDGQSL